jgi:hypothetical protein
MAHKDNQSKQQFAERQLQVTQDLDRAIGHAIHTLVQAQQLLRANLAYVQLRDKADKAAILSEAAPHAQEEIQPSPPWLYGQEPDLQ